MSATLERPAAEATAVRPTSSTFGVALIAVHAILIGLFAVAALLEPPARGWAVLACVVAYAVVLPLAARADGRRQLVSLWAFLVPVSAFQLLPDWVLADLIGTIRFPDAGGPRVDDVIPLAMAGMWIAPLFLAVALARGSAWRAGGIALLVFAGAEVAAPVLGVWEPTDAATQVGGVALYVLPAEAVLGAAALLGHRWAARRARIHRVGIALGISTLYLGALVLAHFVIDVAGWRVTV